jgi:hypothetical protein
MRAILRSYLAEINLGSTVPSAGGQLQFQDFPQLRDVVIYGIEALDYNVLSTSPTNKTIVSVLTGITLTIVDKFQKEKIQQYPTFDLNPFNTGGLYRDFVPFQLNLVKSYITINNNLGLNANESVCFNVFYATPGELKEFQAATSKSKRNV